MTNNKNNKFSLNSFNSQQNIVSNFNFNLSSILINIKQLDNIKINLIDIIKTKSFMLNYKLQLIKDNFLEQKSLINKKDKYLQALQTKF